MHKHIVFVLCVILFLCASWETKAQYQARFHQVFVPAKYVALMKRHILTIEKNGWGKLDQDDLYHGHLLLPPQKTTFSESLLAEKLFEASVGVLYHSDERLLRWRFEDGELPVEKRRPRSFVAYWNGNIVTAVSLFEKVDGWARHYSCCGTVHLDELASVKPKEFAFWRSYQVATSDSRPCHVNLIIDIYYSSLHPPVIEVSGKKYVMTMDCAEARW